MVELKSFLPRLLPNVMGCTEPLALQALLDSAIEFSRRSLAVTTRLEPIPVEANIADYELQPPAQTAISQVLKVWVEGELLSAAPYETATATAPHKGTPRHFYGQEIDENFYVTLLPTPDKTIADALVARVALQPTRSATRVHDILYDRHAEGVVYGAMAILMAIADQPFTDTIMAGAASAKARALANNARFEAMHGRVQSSLSVRMRAF